MILPIYTNQQPVLRQHASQITSIDQHILDLVSNMRDTLYASNGIGLAAPQIGKSIALFVVEFEDENGNMPFTAFINPKITWKSSRKIRMMEGCLSLPEVEGEVIRPDAIDLSYTNLSGDQVSLEADGLLSRVIQHETDHLNGILFTDYIPEHARKVISDSPKYPII